MITTIRKFVKLTDGNQYHHLFETFFLKILEMWPFCYLLSKKRLPENTIEHVPLLSLLYIIENLPIFTQVVKRVV